MGGEVSSPPQRGIGLIKQGQKVVHKNVSRIKGNYEEKLSQKIMRRNYYQKL